jgi:flagellar basal-body rod protein FlgF
MNYGLYSSAAGILTSMHRQDVASNNLANAATIGFKRDLAAMRSRPPASQTLPDGADAAQDMLDKLGGGIFVQPTRVDTTNGSLQATGSPLDLAIRGDGFFVVQSTDAKAGNPSLLTRDGRFTIAPSGNLVTLSGNTVLNTAGQPIHLDMGKTTDIDGHGVVRQNGSEAGRIQIIHADPAEVRHVGGSAYTAPNSIKAALPATGLVSQGQLEQSNVEPVHEMLEMLDASRAVNMSGTMIHYQDLVMDKAANVLGRVA